MNWRGHEWFAFEPTPTEYNFKEILSRRVHTNVPFRHSYKLLKQTLPNQVLAVRLNHRVLTWFVFQTKRYRLLRGNFNKNSSARVWSIDRRTYLFVRPRLWKRTEKLISRRRAHTPACYSPVEHHSSQGHRVVQKLVFLFVFIGQTGRRYDSGRSIFEHNTITLPADVRFDRVIVSGGYEGCAIERSFAPPPSRAVFLRNFCIFVLPVRVVV